jgi:hypothetical protein
MTEVRINFVKLAKPGKAQKGNHAGAVTSAWQIVDAETGHSMGAGLWASREGAEACCKRSGWRVIATVEAAA